MVERNLLPPTVYLEDSNYSLYRLFGIDGPTNANGSSFCFPAGISIAPDNHFARHGTASALV